jgi:hypothetical protein
MSKTNSIVMALVVAGMLTMSLPARAGIVDTEQMMAEDARMVSLQRIDRVLAQDSVAAQFEVWGVSRDEVAQRVAALSDQELHQLAQTIANDPAGGSDVLVIMGAVFVVLLLLELVGITNFFRRV